VSGWNQLGLTGKACLALFKMAKCSSDQWKCTKIPMGKKRMSLDCQHIQKKCIFRMLQRSFLPDAITEQLRTYTRHRLYLTD
jgi:hypothetical protein